MVHYYKTIDDDLQRIDKAEPGCWISVEEPTEEEIRFLSKEFSVETTYLTAALDLDEASYVLYRENMTLVVLDMPIEDTDLDDGLQFDTMPIGFIIKEDYLITVTASPSPITDEIINKKSIVPKWETSNTTAFFLSVTYHVSSHFIMHLESIDEVAFKMQKEMSRAMKNQELLQLLNLQKSLVRFTTSLKSTHSTLEKIQVSNIMVLNTESLELLGNTLIEVKQSIETSAIYTAVLSTTMDAVAAIISNNMNIVMKSLTALTLVLSIPNMVFGFYGMNVAFPAGTPNIVLPILTTLAITGVAAFVLYINGFFEK